MEYAHIMPEDIFKNPEVKVYVKPSAPRQLLPAST